MSHFIRLVVYCVEVQNVYLKTKDSLSHFHSHFSVFWLNCSFNKPDQTQYSLPRLYFRCKYLKSWMMLGAITYSSICSQTPAFVKEVLNPERLLCTTHAFICWCSAEPLPPDNVVKRLKLCTGSSPFPPLPLQLSHRASFDDSIKLLPRSLTSFCL